MKKIVFLCIVFAVLMWFVWFGPTAKITIHVVTDDGQSIPNAPISLSTFNHWQPGEGFGRDIDSSYTGSTDSKGFVTFTISSPRGDFGFGTENGLNGYYPRGGKYQFTNNCIVIWQPWNPTVDLILKQIVNPIPMYARAFGKSPDPNLPKPNTPVGFDLEAADYVAPYGKGITSDFLFTLTNPDPKERTQTSDDTTLTISFSNNGDGIQPVNVSADQKSFFRMLCDAPETGYETNFSQKNSQIWVHGMLQENQNYFYRVRTVLDDKGNVKSALYGKIRGPIQFWGNGEMFFTYYLNPTPNDRNMEFDPKKNLFQNLPMMGQVQAP